MFNTLNSCIHTAHTPTFLLSKRLSSAYTLSYRHYPLLFLYKHEYNTVLQTYCTNCVIYKHIRLDCAAQL